MSRFADNNNGASAPIDLASLERPAISLREPEEESNPFAAPGAAMASAQNQQMATEAAAQMLSHLLTQTTQQVSASASFSRAQANTEDEASSSGEVSLSEIKSSGQNKGSTQSRSNAILDSFARKNPDTTNFINLVRNTPTAKSIEEAVASGKTVTIFAPSNDAMKRQGLNDLKKPSLRKQRHKVADAHVALNFDESVAMAKYGGISNFGAPSVPTLNPDYNIHLSTHPSEPEGAEYLAVSTNNEAEPRAAARIEASTRMPRTGHTLHEIDNALLAE